ncbi:hypothetical protein LVJ94_18130 [Pendulispora rubella]|uniref:Cytochrome c domain-containing protein n=1 Tax=Pendulispora rubella TaxID=2741070 RepID=A0ABZ2LED7_9BACT
MNRHLLSALAAAVLAAACSQGPQGTLEVGDEGGNGAGNGNGGGNGAGNGAGNGGGNGGGGIPNQPPPPPSGPGSVESAGHKAFNASVYPKIGRCVECHANGTAGAPKFLTTDANTSYQGLDARGLIVPNSLVLTKGSHASGAAPALDAAQSQAVQEWLTQEAADRGGQQAPENILEKMGGCLDEAKFKAIGFQNLTTTKRQGENRNNCTGCDNAKCRTCHTGGDGGFYMAAGSNLDTSTFQETKSVKYIVKYLGLNGTEPVASNAIQAKADATAKDKPYSHPLFTLKPEMKTAIDAFVNDAIAKYKAGSCGQANPPPSADAGADAR